LKTPRGYHLITETLEDYLPGFYHDKLVYVSGPAHAEEVAQGKITGLIAASANPKNAIIVRDLISSERMLVYASLDPIGVQVCAAAKNVVAIAFGILDALKQNVHIFGDNTESLLLAAGLNEIQTLGMALGATHSETFTSIAGVGDLDVTCRSVFGRNRRFGQDIVNLKIGYLPEGAAAAKAIHEIAAEKNLSLPICDGVYRLLNRECAVHELFIELCGSGFSRK
jgi:glycerol-3-phosphate dehydrogenase (NAD(P)+)